MSIRSCAVWVSSAALAVTGQVVVAGTTYAAPAGTAVVTAGDTWGPVHAFERYPHGQSMTVDARGVTTVVWGSQKGWPEPVKVAQRTAAGRWLAPRTLGEGYDPVVAVDASGDLTVAWCRDRTGFTTGVWAARKPFGSPWTPAVHLSRDPAAPGYPDGESSYGALDLDVAVHRGGATLVTWQWGSVERRIPFRIQSAYRPARGPWGSMHALTPAAAAANAHAAFAPSGRAWVAFERTPASGPTAVKVRSRSTTGVWSPAQRVGTSALGDLGVGRHGAVTVVFSRQGRVRVAQRPATTGVWKAPVPVTPSSVRIDQWSVALSPSGAALVAYLWKRDRVDAVRRTTAGLWTEPLTLADPTVSLAGVMTGINARGDMFAGWDNSYGMWGRARPAGQAWHAVTTAQPDTGQVDVLEATQALVTPGGDVALLWAQEERALRVRFLDVS
jgi:hypothetical protein